MLGKIIKNTTSNVVLFVVKLGITFVMTPIFVRNLGNYDYGIWEVVTVIIGYMGMLDMGFGPAASRYAAFYNARKDIQSLNKVFSTAVFFMFVIGVFLFAVMAIWGVFFPHTLAETQEGVSKYTWFLIIIGMQLIFAFPGRIAESFLEGFQMYHIKNMISLIGSLIGASILYKYMTPDNALVLLALISGIRLAITYLIYFFMLARKNFGDLHFRLSNVSIEQFREMILFGYKTFVQGAASRIAGGANRLIIATFLGPAVVIFYSLSASLTSYVSTVRSLLTHAFMPLFSHYHAIDRTDEIRKWFLFGTKVVDACVYIMVLNILFLGKDFIAIWIGPEYAERGEIVLYLLCAHQFLVSFSPFSGRYLTAINKHGYIAKVMSIGVLAHIALSIALSFVAGIYGVAAGVLLPVLVTMPLILRYTCRNLGISVGFFLKDCVLPLIVPTVSLLIGMVLIKSYMDMDSYMNLIIAGGIGTLLFGICFWFFSVTHNERNYLFSRVFRAGSR